MELGALGNVSVEQLFFFFFPRGTVNVHGDMCL